MAKIKTTTSIPDEPHKDLALMIPMNKVFTLYFHFEGYEDEKRAKWLKKKEEEVDGKHHHEQHSSIISWCFIILLEITL